MNKKTILWIGIAVTVLSMVFAAFTDVASDIPAIATGAFGLGLIIASIWNKSEKADWKLVLAIVFAVLGGFLCALAGLGETTYSALITGIGGVIALIISIIITNIKK